MGGILVYNNDDIMNSQWSYAKSAFVIFQWEMDTVVCLHRKFHVIRAIWQGPVSERKRGGGNKFKARIASGYTLSHLTGPQNDFFIRLFHKIFSRQCSENSFINKWYSG